jgi:hypothetical protein
VIAPEAIAVDDRPHVEAALAELGGIPLAHAREGGTSG